jgi:hypothetical protein
MVTVYELCTLCSSAGARKFVSQIGGHNCKYLFSTVFTHLEVFMFL